MKAKPSQAKKRLSSQQMVALAAKLPDNWKCKRNKTGAVYFFNELTKQSQWNFPKVTKVIEAPASPSRSAESSQSSSQQDPTTGSSEISKIYKDQFREKLSRLVVKLLQPYMNASNPIGRIDNVADFKHLARKITHTVLEKEVSRSTNLEHLDLDSRIKVRTIKPKPIS